MDQSEYGGLSNFGGGGGLGIPTIGRETSLIPTIETGTKSRRMAGRPTTAKNEEQQPPSLSNKAGSKNYGLFLNEEASNKGGVQRK